VRVIRDTYMYLFLKIKIKIVTKIIFVNLINV
jgi:hypothetical protein